MNRITKKNLKEFAIEHIETKCTLGEYNVLIDNVDEFHDLMLDCKINGIRIEDDDDLYNEMVKRSSGLLLVLNQIIENEIN